MRRRRRRPTIFVVIMIIFAAALLLIILTSKNFKNMIASFGSGADTEDTTGDIGTHTETEPPETEPVTSPLPVDDSFLICIDPGHGFGDVGTSSPNLGSQNESDINFAVAIKVYEILKASGYNVALSHDNVTIPKTSVDDGNDLFYINERAEYANEIGADLFVSIHCDAFEDDDSVHGTRVYYCGEYEQSEASSQLTAILASKIDAKFTGAKKVITYERDFESAFYVTKYVKAPAALIELGFISNMDDADNMLSEAWRTEMAEAIAEAITEYIRRTEGTSS